MSLFTGDDHRKVWEVCSFHQRQQGRQRTGFSHHAGRVAYGVTHGRPNEQIDKSITAAPYFMWSTDGTKIITINDG
jgi:hypothetical protein